MQKPIPCHLQELFICPLALWAAMQTFAQGRLDGMDHHAAMPGLRCWQPSLPLLSIPSGAQGGVCSWGKH